MLIHYISYVDGPIVVVGTATHVRMQYGYCACKKHQGKHDATFFRTRHECGECGVQLSLRVVSQYE